MKFDKVLLTVIFSLTWVFVQSQERCATVPYNELLNQEYKGQYDISHFEKWIYNKIRNEKVLPEQFKEKEEEVYRIPVVIHVIHNGETEGQGSNISDEQILSQIQVLNKDYRRLNGDTINTPEIFKSVAADTYIEFKLAERDPDGQETNGINRIQGTKTEWIATNSADNQELKSMSFWPPEDYMNIWVTTLANNYLGYAQYPITDLPGSIPPYNRETDGVVIHYRAFGSRSYGAFNLFNNYDRGRSTTHEVGHYFGLRHIWGDLVGCGGTDYCDDTPDAYDSYTSCTDIDPLSCASEDMFQNYLDYSYDRCMNIFTHDQTVRMRTVIENSPRRKSLLTSPGLIPPQIEYNFLVVREIISPANIGCDNSFQPLIAVQNNGLNDVVSFKLSLTLDASTYDVAFSGDTLNPGDVRILDLLPNIGSIDLPDGQYYLNAGIRDTNGIDTLDLSEYDIEKYFLVDSREDIAPSIEKFETTDLDMTLWSVYNPDNDLTWSIEEVPHDMGINMAPGVKMYEYYNIAASDWLVSPVINLSEHIDANITFYFSYALGNGAEDVLDLRVSTDCGETWPYTIFSASGEQLVTGIANGPWVPAGPDDWERGYADLEQFAGNELVRIAFITTNLNGNNLYLDNIELYVTGFTQDVTLNENSILIHPNPVDGSNFYVTVKTDERQDVNMQLVDMNGRKVFDKEFTNVLNQTFELDLSSQSAGIYILKAIGQTYNQTTKLILNR
jgi:hypothetical protein